MPFWVAKGWKWRGALAALLALSLAFAPVAAQAVMASHAPAAAEISHRSAGHAEHHGHLTGGEAAAHHDHAHAHDHGDAASLTNEAFALAAGSAGAAPCPQGHADHGNGDAGCCGTFCHTAIALFAVPQTAAVRVRAAFGSFSGMPTESVAPGQPHRPPSLLLSR
jgi:hypothetical protein